MMPEIPCSISNIAPIPVAAFKIRKNNLTRNNLARKSIKHRISSQRIVLPLPSYLGLFSQYQRESFLHHKSGLQILSATGIDVAIEESDSPAADGDSAGASEIPSDEETSESSSTKSEASPAQAQSRRLRTSRKSEMPPVKNEDLVPGAMFTGKVRSIQPFGAFIDFGAFTDGLVHVSRMSDSFVKDVGSFVSVGQEVKVRLIEANTETGRISLSMRESDDSSKLQQQKDAPVSGEKVRSARRSTLKPSQKRDEMKTTKFVKGQDLQGTVKNLTRSGAFINLPEGEEGFLPTSEESDDGLASMMGGSPFQVGQEVSVRVLRITRGQLTLTMKKEEDAGLDQQLFQGVVHTATNPFLLAFRKNKDISTFLDEREAAKKSEKPTPIEIGEVTKMEAGSSIPKVQDQLASSVEVMGSIPSAVGETVEDDEASSKEKEERADIANNNESTETSAPEESLSIENQIIAEAEAPSTDLRVEIAEQVLSSDDPKDGEVTEGQTEKAVAKDELQIQTPFTGEKETEETIEALALEGSVSTEKQIIGEAASTNLSGQIAEQISPSEGPKDELDVRNQTDDTITKDGVMGSIPSVVGEPVGDDDVLSKEKDEVADIANNKERTETSAPEESVSAENQIIEEASSTDLSVEIAGQGLSSDDPGDGEVTESQTEDAVAKDEVQIQTPFTKEKETVETTEALDPERNVSTEKHIIGEAASTDLSGAMAEQISASDGPKDEVVQNQTNDSIAKEEGQIQTPIAESKIPSVAPLQEEAAGSTLDKNGSITSSVKQSDISSSQETKATVSPALVKQLREETGAGMMDCKKALAETGGDIIKAQEFLRKKGLASAEKKASRATAEGRIGSYIHDSRIGVMVEVNCETDFVSRGDIFKELVDDLAMQVAACPQVKYLVTEDVPEAIVNKEREIEMQKEDLSSKPEQIRSKIVEGRIRKRLEELALLEQPYIKNDKMVVKDWVKQTIATIGENIKVKRFVRYNLGEGLEKKSQDFAAEVAAQTAAKPMAKEKPAPAETKETVEKPPAVAVSAALVKKLREETGAGMMDCKKALSETGGDLEKAQEYLRKKGLSSADKKSSRLAAEGRIGSYIHDARIGVLIEVNCETDFVGRSEKFKELVDDLAMQVVACPQVQFVSMEEIPDHVKNKEKELEMQREDLLSKPENIRERIVEGRIAKRLGELALLEQPFIKDDGVLVKDLVKQSVAAIGENIKVRRFVRFTLGETNEDAKTEA